MILNLQVMSATKYIVKRRVQGTMWIYCCHGSIGHLFMLLIWPVMSLPMQKHACHTQLKQCVAIAEGALKSPVQKGTSDDLVV